MKKRFSDAQIINILREAEAGGCPGTLPQVCYFRRHLPHLEQEVWWYESARSEEGPG